ncbi:MAG: hypothetical protein K2N72_11990, partial [Oscillospiraceae bacterium]|nr:hypothetical protein [Oscillospiraceae bacterium]
MITWTNKEDESWEGEFKSRIFHDEDDDNLIVYIENPSAADHAERCAAFLDSLPEVMIDEICGELIKCAERDGDNSSFKLPELHSVRDILDYCWFVAVYVSVPKNENDISFIVEGEGDWGECAGFVIENGRVVYVGNDAVNY